MSDILIPERIDIPVDEARLRSGKPEDLIKQLQDMARILIEAYETIANAFRARPEFIEAATQPDPAQGQFAVWHDTTASKYYLCYNDAGTVVKVEMT